MVTQMGSNKNRDQAFWDMFVFLGVILDKALGVSLNETGIHCMFGSNACLGQGLFVGGIRIKWFWNFLREIVSLGALG